MILAAALGGLAGADRTAFAQSMLAHPVVCGTFAGWIAGDPVSGLRLGIVYGMFGSRRAPIGGTGPVLDWTSAAVAVPLALGDAAAGWQWGLGLALGVLVALLGGHVIRGLRGLAASREEALAGAAARGDLGAIGRVHLSFLAGHVLRGAAVSLAGAAVISWLAYHVRWSGPEQSAAAMIWGLAPVCAATVLVDAHRRAAGWAPVAFGGLVGLAVILWLAVLS
jgi:mannose/fructose/N-acetylgalactosamine-specific phosphotransferase system component IIC